MPQQPRVVKRKPKTKTTLKLHWGWLTRMEFRHRARVLPALCPFAAAMKGRACMGMRCRGALGVLRSCVSFARTAVQMRGNRCARAGRGAARCAFAHMAPRQIAAFASCMSPPTTAMAVSNWQWRSVRGVASYLSQADYGKTSKSGRVGSYETSMGNTPLELR